MKVGEYIRTRDGEIYKITKLDGFDIGIDYDLYSYGYDDYEEQYYFITDSFEYGEVDKHYIIKSSPNLIDLIEVGDIVNYDQLNGGVFLNKKDDSIDTWSILPNSLKNEDIKSVITKEQLKNCMYEVGELDER